jgi:uncharacterized protein (TIGR03000 family)
MTRPFLLLALCTALATAAGTPRVAGQEASPANLVVTLPADARLYFDGALTRQTGPVRNFDTPPLNPGVNYTYELKAELDRDGHVQTQTQRVRVRAGETTRVDFSSLGTGGAGQGPADGEPPADDSWPRKITSNGYSLTVYQPQIEKWDRNRLEARAAVPVETKASPQPTYGVVWITARTEVDKEHRLVTLDDIAVPRANFPSAPDRADEYLAAVRKTLPSATTTLALDRLEANLAVTQAEAKRKRLPLKNEPPRILFSTKPALLVLIDGKPVLRQMEGVNLLRVINTRALLLLDESAGKYYLRLMDRWMEAAKLEGPWAVAQEPPAALQTVLDKVGNDPQVDLLDDLAADLKDALENGTVPAIYVSTVPAELIMTEGEPDLAPIEGTKLLWVKNTTSQVLLDTADQNYYVLLSGRWFRSKSLTEGPWEFVPADKLPADFAKVPETHPRGDVLASVAGTPQAEEAAIANEVPQTATIKRSEAKVEPVYDGDPQFQPIEGTNLQYAVNTPTPVVHVSPDSYYACANGVWFTAAAPTGPWVAATSVPEVIYSIPPSSPIYYATNVYVYGSTPEYVYTGYTPGYFGTCLSPWNVVVFGTGWNFAPWIGRFWFGRPWTFGWGVRFGWTSGGWGFGFAAGWGRPWWGPIGWNAGWARGPWRNGWERGWGGLYAGSHINHINFNNFNLYHRWRDNVHAARRTGITARRTTNLVSSRRGLNNVIAGRDGHVYRRDGNGWATHSGTGWRRVEPGRLPAERRQQFANTARRLDGEWTARRSGEVRHNTFHATPGYRVGHPAYTGPRPGLGGPAGFHGGVGGFRGYHGGGGHPGGHAHR